MIGNNEIQNKDLLGITFRGSKGAINYTKMSTMKLDKNGVLLSKIPYTDNFDYYPIFMARYSLGNLEMYLETKDTKYEGVFLNQVDWLLKNLVDKHDFAVWEHHYNLPYYNFNPPWIHGLGQCLGMTALLKAYQISGEDVYLEASKKIYRSFEIEISEGGVKFIDDNNNVWLEEYAIIPPPHVLNGFITILFGIHEFYRITNTEKAQNLFNVGIKTLIENLWKFDLGYWSLYNLLQKYPSPSNYHSLHIRQLNVLYELTGENIFKEYARLWEEYKNKWINRNYARVKRVELHLKNYGIKGCVMRYYKRKKWKKE